MADPSTMFGNLPPMEASPLTGYMRGISSDYAINQQDQESNTRNLQNIIRQMGIDKDTADLPNQAAARANLGASLADIKQGWDSGQQGKMNEGDRDVHILNNLRKKSQSELTNIEQQATWSIAVNEAMSKAQGPAEKADLWRQFKSSGESIGIKGITETYDEMSGKIKANARAGVFTKPLLEKVILKDQDIAGDIQKVDAQGKWTVKAATIRAGASASDKEDWRRANLTPEKRFYSDLDKKSQAGVPLSTADISKAYELEVESLIKTEPTKNAAMNTEAQQSFRTTDSAGKKKLNLAEGLPEDNADTVRYSKRVVEQANDRAAKRSLINKFGDDKMEVGDKIVPVREYLAGKTNIESVDTNAPKGKSLTNYSAPSEVEAKAMADIKAQPKGKNLSDAEALKMVRDYLGKK